MKSIFNHVAIGLLLAIALLGCSHKHPRPTLEQVLEANPALTRVMDNYKDDTLKLRAAKFLLSYLPYYYSYSEEDVAPHLMLHEYYGVKRIGVR